MNLTLSWGGKCLLSGASGWQSWLSVRRILPSDWPSREAMETLNGQAQSWTDEFAAMGLLAIPESFKLTSYNIAQ